jgi:hypothetical protein
MLEVSQIKETGAAYRTPTEFFNAYATKRISGVSQRLDHIVLIEQDKVAGRVVFATTSGGVWPYYNELHADQAVFEVTFVGVRDENPDELADLAVAAALEWEHGVVLDETLEHDLFLVVQLWSAMMPLLKREVPEHARRLEKRLMNVEIKRIRFKARKDKASCAPREPYMQIKVGECVVNFNRYADEEEVLSALRGTQAYMHEAV